MALRWLKRTTSAMAAATMAVTLAAALPTIAAAAPGTVSIANGVLTFRAGAATPNDVVVERFVSDLAGVVYRVSDGGSIDGRTPIEVVAGAGCSSFSLSTAFCTVAGTRRIVLQLGDRNDSGVVAYYLRVPATIQGGTGNDRLAGGAAGDLLSDPSGYDQFQGHAGNDRIYTRDRRRDALVDCSSGRDVVIADAIDSPFPGCERVLR